MSTDAPAFRLSARRSTRWKLGLDAAPPFTNSIAIENTMTAPKSATSKKTAPKAKPVKKAAPVAKKAVAAKSKAPAKVAAKPAKKVVKKSAGK